MAELTREQLIERGRLIEIGRQQEQGRAPTAPAAAPDTLPQGQGSVALGAPSGITPGPWDAMQQLSGGRQVSSREALAKTLPMVGEVVGGAIGMTLPPQAITVPALATGGAMIGTSLESLLSKGRFPTLKELRDEAAWSLVPEAIETGIKAAKVPLRRAFQRAVAEKRLWPIHGMSGGRILREAEQYRRVEGQGMRIFNAPTHQSVDQAFDAVRASGMQVHTQQLLDGLDLLTGPERKLLRREIDQADAIINARVGQPGQRTLRDAFTQVEAARPTRAGVASGPIPDLDIGELQNMRSALRERAMHVSGPTADVLLAFSNKIDRAILDTLNPALAPSKQVAGQLLEARANYRRLKAAENLQEYFLQKSGLPTGKGNIRTLRLAPLRDELDKNLTARAKEINQQLDSIPGARARFEGLIKELEPFGSQINTPIGSDTGGLARNEWIAGIFRGISEAVLLSDTGVKLFKDVLKQHKGTITPNQLAVIVNQVRREMEDGLASPEASPAPK